MEWLSRLVSSEEESRRLSGLCIARNSPSISHLFFTDDILIFCQTNLEEVENLIDVFRHFKLCAVKQFLTSSLLQPFFMTSTKVKENVISNIISQESCVLRKIPWSPSLVWSREVYICKLVCLGMLGMNEAMLTEQFRIYIRSCGWWEIERR